MRRAVIDIGTNSVRLLVDQNDLLGAKKDMVVTRIGQGVDAHRMLQTGPMERTAAAVKDLVEQARRAGAEEIYAIATSAMRDAKNGKDFARRLAKENNIQVDIISGDLEAELGYLGVLRGLKSSFQDLLVIDIGGGSTELIFGNEQGIEEMKSFDIGAVRLTELVQPKEMPSQEDCLAMKTLVREKITFSSKAPDKVVGIGGTITTLYAVSAEMETYQRALVHGQSLSKERIEAVLAKFLSLNLQEREALPGLDPKRADIIIAGTIILIEIMERYGVKELLLSDYDNLEGYLTFLKKSVDNR